MSNTCPVGAEEQRDYALGVLQQIADMTSTVEDEEDFDILKAKAERMCNMAAIAVLKCGWPKKPDVNVYIHIELANNLGVAVLAEILFPHRENGEQIGPWSISLSTNGPVLCDALLHTEDCVFEIEAVATRAFQRADVELFVKYIQDLVTVKRITIAEDCLDKCVYSSWFISDGQLLNTFLHPHDWPFDMPNNLSHEEKINIVAQAYNKHMTTHNLQPIKGFYKDEL